MSKPKKKNGKKKRKDRHHELMLRVTDDDAFVLAIERVSSSPPDDAIRPPRVVDDRWYEQPSGTGELILGFHDREGAPCDAVALPLDPRVYRETTDDDGTTRLDPQVDDRLVHLSFPRRAPFLVLYRTRTRRADAPMRGRPIDRTTILCDGPEGERAWDLDVLSAYALDPTGGPTSSLPDGPFGWPLDLPELRFTLPELRRLPSPFTRPPKMRHGWIDSEETYLDHGKPSKRFNLVVLGDGYDRDEIERFDREAKTVIHGLLGGGGCDGLPPFAALRPFINVHLVRAVSRDSGIGRRDGAARHTYYETVAGAGTDDPGTCGTDAPELVWAEGRRLAEPSQVGLWLVLVNGAAAGGSAWVDRRTFYLASPDDGEGMIRLAGRALTWAGLPSILLR